VGDDLTLNPSLFVAGTGLGHVNKPLYAPLQRAIEEGIAVYMTVQTLWGYVQMYVYDTGRDLMKIGVIPAQNMLPEVAYMKLCWALGHTSNLDEVKKSCSHQSLEKSLRENPLSRQPPILS
jgi:glutamyl-tRNA(Gln) amidotransferase subunit D